MHLLTVASLAVFLTATCAADGLQARNATAAACSLIAKKISGASQVYYPGLFRVFIFSRCDWNVDCSLSQFPPIM